MGENQAIRVIQNSGTIPSESEVEAKLHQEGYESFRWYDVPGACYPKHRHEVDECIWIIKGEMSFQIGDQDYPLKPGDRIYIPAMTPHTAKVPSARGVTYLIGQKSR